MKLKITAVFLLFSCFTTSFGQMKQSTFVFGPKIGGHLTRISIIDNPTTIESKGRFDLNGGIFTRLNIGKFSIQPEVVYQNKGGDFKTPAQQHKYRYISTPILFGFTPMKGVYLEAGPEYSWALNKGAANTTRSVYGPDQKNDMGVVVGTRINMLDAVSMFSLNFRYTHGLTNVTNRLSDKTPLDFRNRTFEVSVTYNFSEYYKWQRKYALKKKKK
jgi:Outer membrane protein beta-barrel domain